MPQEKTETVLLVTAKEARKLKNVQLIGVQDPFLTLWVGRGGSKSKTGVHTDGGSCAEWLESFTFGIESIDPDEYLYFEVRNKNITDSKGIGMAKVALRTFGSTEEAKWHVIYDKKGRAAGEVLLQVTIGHRAAGHREATHTPSRFSPAVLVPGGNLDIPTPMPTSRGSISASENGLPRRQVRVNPYTSYSSRGSEHFNPYSSGSTTPQQSIGSSTSQPQQTAAVFYTDRRGSGRVAARGVPSTVPSSSTYNRGDGTGGGHRVGRTTAPGFLEDYQAPPAQSSYSYGSPTSSASERGVTRGYTSPEVPPVPPVAVSPPYVRPAALSPGPPPTGPSAPSVGNGRGVTIGLPPLPPFWEEEVTPQGLTFYVDHRSRTTTWVRPM